MAEKYSFLVIKYPKADTAMAALAVLKELSRDKVVKLRDAVALTKTEKGKIKLHQPKDDSIEGKEGAMAWSSHVRAPSAGSPRRAAGCS
jgi:uncharacterized membrane protein